MSTVTLENDDSSSGSTVSLETSDSSSITEIIETVTEPEPAPEPKTKAPEAQKPKEFTLHAKGELVAGGRALLKVDKKSTLELSRTQFIVLNENGREYHYTRTRV